MKLDQIAYYVHNEDQATQVKKMFGLENAEWVEDIVVGDVDILLRDGTRMKGESKAHLRFCYALGMEFELLTYLEGPHWHYAKPEMISGKIFLSHVGFHMDPFEEMPIEFFNQARHVMLQEMFTKEHTNPFLLESGRRYHYKIMSGLPGMPDQKFIWRRQ